MDLVPDKAPTVAAESTPGTSSSPADETAYYIKARGRELDLREREVAAREREVAAKESELRRSRWANPLVIGLLAAALGLIGNLFVTLLNGKAMQDLERRRAQSNLIVELVKTNNADEAIKNLKFFFDHGLLDDPDNRLRNALQDRNTVPVLPLYSRDFRQLRELVPALGHLVIESEPSGARVMIDGEMGPELTPAHIVVRPGPHQVSIFFGNVRVDEEVLVGQDQEARLHVSAPKK